MNSANATVYRIEMNSVPHLKKSKPLSISKHTFNQPPNLIHGKWKSAVIA